MLRGIFGMLLGMLLILAVMFGNLFLQENRKTETISKVQEAKYHLQILVQNTDEYFWTYFKDGARDAAVEMNAYAEFVPIAQKSGEAIKDAVEKGIYSGVDGIALKPADALGTKEIAKEAKAKKIPLLTYENDSFNIADVPSVGSNSYTIGSMAGKMGADAIGSGKKAVIIMNEAGEEGDISYRNLSMQGIAEAFSSKGNIEIEEVYTLKQNMFEAEKVTYSIIAQHKDINLIICLDEKSTPGVAQVLVDNNLVGDIKLVGYGSMPLTLDYVERGVIYGTVCPNAYEIGYYTVKQLAQALNGVQISDYKSTQLYTIDASNVAEYDDRMPKKEGGE
ncbi:sugar ABC transporter substrate-binding protein [Anaerocolumna xylanovorans]|nr:substrate-binding domain-containing protein [Anaerocolumna xylanovorans]